MCSHGVVINGAAMVRKDKNYHLIQYIFLIFLWEDRKMQLMKGTVADT